MSIKLKSKILWIIFCIMGIYALVRSTGKLLNWEPGVFDYFDFLGFYVPVFFLVLYAFFTLGTKKGSIFLLIAFVISSFFELIGLNNGSMFGGSYIYRTGSPLLFNLPVIVPLYWSGLIFFGYALVSSFLLWTGIEKPDKKLKNGRLLPILLVMDGLIVTGVDIFMDPIAVKRGIWTWQEEGLYFGTPLGNFLGWFCVTITITGLFRIYDYFFPTKNHRVEISVHIIPCLGYGLLCFGLGFKALQLHLPQVALIGFFVMFPIILINLILFFFRVKRQS
jgi:putative membrane protein